MGVPPTQQQEEAGKAATSAPASTSMHLPHSTASLPNSTASLQPEVSGFVHA